MAVANDAEISAFVNFDNNIKINILLLYLKHIAKIGTTFTRSCHTFVNPTKIQTQPKRVIKRLCV